jgi:hypothetical protein
MRNERERKARAIPFPKSRELSTEISEVDDRLRDLRKRGRSAADAHSAARFAAEVQVDLIASGLGLQRHLNELAFQLLVEECPLQERIRRLRILIRMTNKVQVITLRATDVYLSCFGGKEAIAIQAIAEWITRLRERSPADAAQIDQILKMMIEKSAK